MSVRQVVAAARLDPCLQAGRDGLALALALAGRTHNVTISRGQVEAIFISPHNAGSSDESPLRAWSAPFPRRETSRAAGERRTGELARLCAVAVSISAPTWALVDLTRPRAVRIDTLDVGLEQRS
jgi:hypothetical protein